MIIEINGVIGAVSLFGHGVDAMIGHGKDVLKESHVQRIDPRSLVDFPPDRHRPLIAVAFPHSSIGLLCQSEQSVEKRIALAMEESRVR